MLEATGDILHEMSKYNAVCITTNGIVKPGGRAVMGAGVAKVFRDSFKGIDFSCGAAIAKHGNRVNVLGSVENCIVLTFPTKHDWKDYSDLGLIKQSAFQLMGYINTKREQDKDFRVLLPRPGCVNGGLDWETTVKPVLSEILDDSVTIITKGGN